MKNRHVLSLCNEVATVYTIATLGANTAREIAIRQLAGDFEWAEQSITPSEHR